MMEEVGSAVEPLVPFVGLRTSFDFTAFFAARYTMLCIPHTPFLADYGVVHSRMDDGDPIYPDDTFDVFIISTWDD